MPAVGALADEYGVARATVVKALRILTDQGLVVVLASYGTFRSGG